MSESATVTYFPIVCKTCGKPLGRLERPFYRIYQEIQATRSASPETSNPQDVSERETSIEEETMNRLGLTRYCCRTAVKCRPITSAGSYLPPAERSVEIPSTQISPITGQVEVTPGIQINPELARILQMLDFSSRNFTTLPGALNATTSSHVTLGSRIKLSPSVTVLPPATLNSLPVPPAETAATLVPLEKPSPPKPEAALVKPSPVLVPLIKPKPEATLVKPSPVLAPLVKPKPEAALVKPSPVLVPLVKPKPKPSPVLVPLVKPSPPKPKND